MVNSVVLVGRIASPPEMKYLPTGTPVANFRLAVDRGMKSEGGERQTDWLTIVCYQKTAELVAEYCDKGMLVGIEGRIQSRSWGGEGGKKNYVVEIVANNVRFLESRVESERRRAGKGEAWKPDPAGAGEGADVEEDLFGGEGD
ncbi:MAG: single-stranded DNA-binding protein [bacterium]